MIASEERDKSIIAHILKYCKRIDECFSRFGNSYEIFLSDDIFRDAVSMAELQIGELSGHLSYDFKERTKEEIPWNEVRGMRNHFAHDYINMDIEKIWNVATEYIHILRKFCEAQLKAFEQTDD